MEVVFNKILYLQKELIIDVRESNLAEENKIKGKRIYVYNFREIG